jgi:hypothetical protein
MDSFKLKVKAWLKSNSKSYKDLAEVCQVTELTVRNWMAKKKIPPAKLKLIEHYMDAQQNVDVPVKYECATEDACTVFRQAVSTVAKQYPELDLTQSVYTVLGILSLQ